MNLPTPSSICKDTAEPCEVRCQICVCYDVYDDEIQQAIQAGSMTVEQIGDTTYAGQGCGGCHPKLLAMLEMHS